MASILFASQAGADSSTGAVAQALYDQAKKLMSAGNFAEACPKLQESQRLDPGGGTILLLARCHAKEGRNATAWVEYQEALRTAVRDNRKERERIARDEGALLEPKLSKLVIEVTRSELAPGTVIRRDGIEVGAAEWSLPVAVNPGPHEVVVTAPGRLTWSKTLDVGRERAVVTVKVQPLAMATAQAATPPAPPSAPTTPAASVIEDPGIDERGRGTGLRIGGAVAGGAGVVLLGVGSVFALKAKSLNDRSNSSGGCVGNACPQDGYEVRHEAESKARTATVLVGLGAAAMAGAAILWLIAPRGSSVSVGMTTGELLVRGAW